MSKENMPDLVTIRRPPVTGCHQAEKDPAWYRSHTTWRSAMSKENMPHYRSLSAGPPVRVETDDKRGSRQVFFVLLLFRGHT